MKRLVTVIAAIGALGLGNLAAAQAQENLFADLIPKTRATALPAASPSDIEPGPYQITPAERPAGVWVINTATGALRLCLPPIDAATATPV